MYSVILCTIRASKPAKRSPSPSSGPRTNAAEDPFSHLVHRDDVRHRYDVELAIYMDL